MTLRYPSWVKETSITTGTGSYALAGAATDGPFIPFASGMSVGDTCPVMVTDGVDTECGLYTLTASSTLARTTITESSNGGAAVSWGAGTKTIAVVPIAALFDTLKPQPEYFLRTGASRTLTNSAAQQAIFGTTLPAIVTGIYEFDLWVYLTGMSSTSGNAGLSIIGAGTATLASPGGDVLGIDAATPTAAAARTGSAFITSASPASAVTAATATAAEMWMRGFFDCTASGTIIPSITLVNAAGAALDASTTFRCRRIGPTAATSGSP